MKDIVSKSLIISLALFLAVAGTVVRSALAITGATFTTDISCSGTNVNLFSSKDAVYLDGGPNHGSSAGLPDGYYYVEVTDPNNNDAPLGTSIGSGNNTPVHVTNGSFDKCYQLSAILIKASDNTAGYDTTTNNGGEYKVSISSLSNFSGDSTKTDNFKVNSFSATPTITVIPTATPSATVTPTITVTPTATPSATPSVTDTPTVTPTPTTTNSGCTSNCGSSDNNNNNSNNNSSNNSQPTQAVLAASTMAATGTFETTLMNFMLVAGMMVLALGATSYAKEKKN